MRTITPLILILGLLSTSCDVTSSKKTDLVDDIITFQTLFQSFQTHGLIDDYKTVEIENHQQASGFLATYLSKMYEEHKLFEVNYTDSLVLGILVGARPNTSYSIEIDSIIVSGNINQIYATESGSAFGGRAVVWPAHFISVNKKDFGNRKTTFNLTRLCESEPCAWQN